MQVRSHRRIRSAAVALAAGLALVACGSSSPSSTTETAPVTARSDSTTAGAKPPTTDAATGAAVSIDDFAFSPAALTVTAGTTVTWTNNQGVTHTVTADDGSWDSGDLATGETFTHTFDTAGTFAYHCAIHPTMKASVVVSA
jgi:plastocyanin